MNNTKTTTDKQYHTVSGNFVQGYVMLVGHVPKEGKDHKAREETGQRVDGAGDDSVSGLKE